MADTKEQEQTGIKTYALIDIITGEDESNIANNQPRAAALKAVGILRRGKKDFSRIFLREKGTMNNGNVAKLHEFAGSNRNEKATLPIPIPIRAGYEKAAGKKIPAAMNVKGKENELEALMGVALPFVNLPNVKKIGVHHVPKVEGKDRAGAIAAYLKGLPAPVKATAKPEKLTPKAPTPKLNPVKPKA